MSNLTPSQARGVKITIAVILAFIVGVLFTFYNRIQMPRILSEGEMRANGAWMFDTPRSFGELTLVDHQGQPFDHQRLEGQWSLVFFGFTHCPDICPTTMAFLSQFVGELPADEQPQVVMVTVDPARDTVEKLATYVPWFNPDFVGVTGEFMDIHRFATALNTPFRKVSGQGENYEVDHSANVALINPKGDYHGFFKAPQDLAKMKLTYRSALARWDF